MTAKRWSFYNDNDPFACEWTRNLIKAGLIPPGEVDERDVWDIRPDDLAPFCHVHLCNGISGWAYALRLARWPDDRPVWSASLPCQPFSEAGKRAGFADERHLWPAWRWLIRECRPHEIIGEQVSSPDGLAWLDVVSTDLEDLGYAVGAISTNAAGVSAPHIRQRLYFVGHAESDGWSRGQNDRDEGRGQCSSGQASATSWMGDTIDTGLEGWAGESKNNGPQWETAERTGSAIWSDLEWLPCQDGKYRPSQPGLSPLSARLPRGFRQVQPQLSGLGEMANVDATSLTRAKRNRRGRLKGYGNSIVPEVAAAFIRAYLENT